MVTISEKALNKLEVLRKEEGYDDSFSLRVSVKGGGCSGLMYDMGFDNQQKDGDEIYENGALKVLVDKKSLLYLMGTTLEYSDGLNGKGFQFVNPNAARTCGCGESFAL